ncbi:MAG: thymidylate synthase [Candidatus Nitrosotenuis sp.]
MTYIMSAYDEALRFILEEGYDQPDRTGVGRRTLIGLTTRYDLSTGRVPVLTYRKVKWQAIVSEVLWYLSGSDNIHDLEALGSKVWNPWINDEFTKKHGLKQGSIGYGYGPNLIKFGCDLQQDYKFETYSCDPHNDHPGPKGFNQVDYVINELKTKPWSTQALFTLWRPDKVKEVVLPSCHHTYQFILRPDKNGNPTNLVCFLFQRSNDYPVGVGMANLFTAALFTRLIALELGVNADCVVHTGSHCHIYFNQFNAVNEYLLRVENLPAKASPILNIEKQASIYDYKLEHFTIDDYDAYDIIKFPVAV